MKIQGIVAKEKLSTNLNEVYIIPDLDLWIPGYTELPDTQKISVDVKHLTAGDLASEFKDLKGGYARHSIFSSDVQRFLKHTYKVYEIEDNEGNKITDPAAIANVGKGSATSLCAEIMIKTIDHLYDSATLTEAEIKNS